MERAADKGDQRLLRLMTKRVAVTLRHQRGNGLVPMRFVARQRWRPADLSTAIYNPITPVDADNIMVPLKARPKQRLLSDTPGSRLEEHVGAHQNPTRSN
jgi:hypothetical protein